MRRVRHCLRRRMLDSRGQAIFEFLMFVGFFLFIFSNYLSIAESINGSINQQKVSRGYFFSRIKGNSFAPQSRNVEAQRGVKRIGMAFIGWREKSMDEKPFAPCYGLKSMGTGQSSEKCDDEYSSSDKTTQFIRVKTAFGVCGETYEFFDSGGVGPSTLSGDFSSCTSTN